MKVLATRINRRMTTQTVNIATLRSWLGVPEGKLVHWSDLRRKAVEPAVREVNAYSPINVEIKPMHRGRKVIAAKLSWSRKKPFSPAEQAATHEVNRQSAGRKARTRGTVEQAVDSSVHVEGAPELPTGMLKRARDTVSAEVGIRLDIHAAYADWHQQVAGMGAALENVSNIGPLWAVPINHGQRRLRCVRANPRRGRRIRYHCRSRPDVFR